MENLTRSKQIRSKTLKVHGDVNFNSFCDKFISTSSIKDINAKLCKAKLPGKIVPVDCIKIFVGKVFPSNDYPVVFIVDDKENGEQALRVFADDAKKLEDCKRKMNEYNQPGSNTPLADIQASFHRGIAIGAKSVYERTGKNQEMFFTELYKDIQKTLNGNVYL